MSNAEKNSNQVRGVVKISLETKLSGGQGMKTSIASLVLEQSIVIVF